MTPAKSQDAPFVTPITKPESSAGFGKVLSSIQGLQQRLDDFSIEEVNRAEAKAATFVQQLSLMEVKLALLPLIKDALRDAQRATGALDDENFELIGLATLEKYSSLSSLLATAGKLQRAVRACPEKLPVSDPALKKQESPTSAPTPIGETEPLDSAGWVLGDDPTASPQEARAIQDFDFRFDTETSGPLQAEPLAVASGDPSKEQTVGGNAPPFDQRLLDHLIKTYGDFASFSSARRAPEKAPEPAAMEALQPKLPAMLPDLRPEHSRRALLTRAPHTSATPALIPPETPRKTTFVEQGETPKPAMGAGTSLTRRGDIDRQLKRIVQDYGEYDLYSHRSSTRTKVAGIIAFTLLGLLMAAFYAFKAPPGMADHPTPARVRFETQPSGERPPAAVDSPLDATQSPKNEK
ncbi:MAG TPA: hypothetical protein VNM15_01985 [Candidatus Binatia bacterium]|nr:hypothetical protein [Candidatus Binatia bacterium]